MRRRVGTPYMRLCLEATESPLFDSIGASVCAWLALAGYVVIPGAFTSITSAKALSDSQSGKLVQKTIQNVPLLYVSGSLFVASILGTALLWIIWRKNPVWLCSRLFL